MDETTRRSQIDLSGRSDLDDLPDAAGEDVGELIGVLRRVSRSLDRLWSQALTNAQGDVAMRLGDASQGVHRALVALREDTGGLPPHPVLVRT